MGWIFFRGQGDLWHVCCFTYDFVDFCITPMAGKGGTVLRIDGRLGREGLAVLMRACEEADRPITLDLSDLRLADDAAVAALRRLESGGIRLVGASQYLALRLKARGDGA